jgi:3-deoxy-manno-octulosonate cytidylyltransferase (CMP-KDO synthetase)
MRAVAVIPARYGSTRLPAKMLAPLAGRPLVEHAWRAAVSCARLSRVMVATDDARIADAVRAFGGEAVMTSSELASGTDRLAAATRGVDADLLVNVQGDEPLMEGAVIDSVLDLMQGGRFDIGTAVVALEDEAEYRDPGCVKAVMGEGGRALYFSRAPVPHGWRTGEPGGWRHIGIYAYRPAALARFVSLPPSPLETCERLEQLRALSDGMSIGAAVVTGYRGFGVDTIEDLARAERMMAKEPASGEGR